MKTDDYWNMFIGTGSIEGYLLYRMIERQASESGGNQDKGTDSKLE